MADLSFDFKKLKEDDFKEVEKAIRKKAGADISTFGVGKQARKRGMLIKPVRIMFTEGTELILEVGGNGMIQKATVNKRVVPMSVADLNDLGKMSTKLSLVIDKSEKTKAKKNADTNAGEEASKPKGPKFTARNLPKKTGATTTIDEKIAEHQAAIDDLQQTLPKIREQESSVQGQIDNKTAKVAELDTAIDAAYDQWAVLRKEIKAYEEAA